MYKTQKNNIKGLSKTEYEALRQLCKLSKNLYNVALYSIKQHYFQEKKHLNYESNYHVCKDNDNYKQLNTDIAQQTLKIVDRNFKSFYALIKKAKFGDYRFQDIKMPKYLPKDDFFSLVMPRIKVKDGKFKLPMSPQFRKQWGNIFIPFPERLKDKDIKEIRIHPKYKATFFEVEFIYEEQPQATDLDINKALAIDFGIDNLATCCTSFGTSFIIDGKKLKSLNQWYNKENARLQSIKNKQGTKGYTKKQTQLTIKRNNQVRDYMNKTARTIINYCIQHQIGTLIVGYNLNWKQRINLGKSNNQKFNNIPHGDLRRKLESLCEYYGIQFHEQEESYTSKASFFDSDEIPTYNADNPKEYKFSGKRISRGRYLTSNGEVINADCNGALNILRKSNLISLLTLQDSGCLVQPLRIRIT